MSDIAHSARARDAAPPFAPAVRGAARWLNTSFGTNARILLVVACALLICARMPDIVLHGRFWAEEGQNFYKTADELPWRGALLHPFGGYLNIVANAATLLAHAAVQLEWAPYVTIAIALLFQITPAILIVTTKEDWLRPRWATLAAVLVVATPPDSEEVWLHTLHSQFHLAICAGLILAMNARAARPIASFRLALLLLGPLSGPAAIMFLPFFAVAAAVERTPARLLQVAALGIGSALQLGFFYSADPGRGFHFAPLVFICAMFVHHILVPFLGTANARATEAWLGIYPSNGRAPWAEIALSAWIFAIWTLAMLRRWKSPPARLMLPGLVVATFSFYGALDGGTQLLDAGSAIRYAFVPQALFALSLVGLAAGAGAGESRPPVWIARAAVAWILVIGASEYFTPSARSYPHGPDWRAEVAAWRADPHHVIALWPRGWTLDLTPKE